MKTKYKEQFRVSLRGVQYSDYQKITNPKIGKQLGIFWEKKNKFDSNALRVEYDGVKLGYIPVGDIQTKIHEAYASGIKIKVVLTAFNKTNPTWQMFTVAVLTSEDIDSDKDTCFSYDSDPDAVHEMDF